MSISSLSNKSALNQHMCREYGYCQALYYPLTQQTGQHHYPPTTVDTHGIQLYLLRLRKQRCSSPCSFWLQEFDFDTCEKNVVWYLPANMQATWLERLSVDNYFHNHTLWIQCLIYLQVMVFVEFLILHCNPCNPSFRKG